jgi:carboxyl-terminal processing protease
VKAGDLILGIKDANKNIDRTTDGITLPDAVSAIRGPLGSTVTLFILREEVSQPFEVDIVRGTIDIPNVTFAKKGDDGSVAVLSVNKFADETKAEWDSAVIEIQKDVAIKYIVIDLRNNPGGYLERSVDLASDFLNVNDIVVIEEDGNKTHTDYKVKNLSRLKNYKTVVLINGGSASASEILAGALMDHKVAKSVGETTFGKGTIQEAEQVENGAGLHITIAKWLTPNGTWINDKGIKPDYEVKDDPETEVDEQLEKAIEVVKN